MATSPLTNQLGLSLAKKQADAQVSSTPAPVAVTPPTINTPQPLQGTTVTPVSMA